MEHKLKKSKRSIQKDEARRNTKSERKLYYSKSVTLYFTLVNIVLEIHKLIMALPKF